MRINKVLEVNYRLVQTSCSSVRLLPYKLIIHMSRDQFSRKWHPEVFRKVEETFSSICVFYAYQCRLYQRRFRAQTYSNVFLNVYVIKTVRYFKRYKIINVAKLINWKKPNIDFMRGHYMDVKQTNINLFTKHATWLYWVISLK